MKNILSLRVLFLLSVLLSFSTQLSAQDDNRLKKADDLFNQFAYPDAAEAYKKILAKDDNIPQAKIKIAEAYRFMNMPIEAEYWYQQVVDLPESEPIHKYYYAMALKANGKFEEAKEMFLQYAQLVPADTRGLRQVEACEQANYFMTDPGIYQPFLAASVNSEKSDFGPAFYKDGIVYASETGVKNKEEIYRWTDAPFLDLMYAKQEGDNPTALGKPENFKGKVNTMLHEGTVTFTEDQQTMYFTRNAYIDGKLQFDSEEILKTVKLQIYEAKADGEKWGSVKSLPFNNESYSVGHPSLSQDGQALYFISDMPGGYGGTDVYVSYKNGDSWGQPENLGPEINTEGNEMFPFMSADGTLYFSSDALPGLGGLDIFSSKLMGDGTWSAPENLRYPINTNSDDFSFIIDPKNEKGYFSSNRTGGKGNDDIYSYTRLNTVMSGIVVDCKTQEPIEGADVELSENGKVIQKRQTVANGTFAFPVSPDKEVVVTASKDGYKTEAQTISTVGISSTQIKLKIPLCPENMENDSTKNGPCTFTLSGKVLERGNNKPVEGALVTITNLDTRDERNATTDANGLYEIKLDKELDYVVHATKQYFFTESKTISTKGKDCDVQAESVMSADFSMGKIAVDPTTGLPISPNGIGEPGFTTDGRPNPNGYGPEGFVLNNIYYDFDQDVIREDAKPELDKVVKLMYDTPGLQIELRSHTDSRGTDEYNTALAERRAKSAYDYIVSRGGANVNVANDVRPKGYGETQPVNECVDGVPCANAKHQENRRTEFVVIGYNANGAIRSAPRYFYRDDYHKGKDYYKKGSGSSSNNSSSVPTSTYKPSGSTSMPSTPSSSAKTQTAAPSVDTSNQFTPKGGNAPTYYDKAAAESTNTGTGVGMEYKIHIGSFRSPDLSKFNVLTDVGTIETEPTESGSQRVILGTFKDKESADAMLSKVKKEGFGEAYVITYQDGLRVGR